MLTNLFSIFDPTISIFNLVPVTIFYLILTLPLLLWCSSFMYNLMITIFSFLFNEIEYSLGSLKKGLANIIISVLVFLFLINFSSLFPFIFSLTSHLSITFPLSFSIWFMVIIFFWSNFFFHFLSHLIPSGTPLLLMSFIVLVELVSNLIRPIALTFRITANIIAGHLLISLIGSFLVSINFSYIILGSFFQIMLVTMELGVSFIQAYVFFTLLILYISEIDSH